MASLKGVSWVNIAGWRTAGRLTRRDGGAAGLDAVIAFCEEASGFAACVAVDAATIRADRLNTTLDGILLLIGYLRHSNRHPTHTTIITAWCLPDIKEKDPEEGDSWAARDVVFGKCGSGHAIS